MAGGVLSRKWSIAYNELSYAIDDDISVASLQSYDGDFVSPYVTNASVATINDITLNVTTNAAEIANLPSVTSSGSYPFLTLGYLILDVDFNSSSSCEEQREILKVQALTISSLIMGRRTLTALASPRSSSAGRSPM